MNAGDELYSNDYFSLWGDGSFGVSDGVGFVGEVEGDAKKLFDALGEYLFHSCEIKEHNRQVTANGYCLRCRKMRTK